MAIKGIEQSDLLPVDGGLRLRKFDGIRIDLLRSVSKGLNPSTVYGHP